MTTVATPDRMNRMNTTLVVRPDQPARADAKAFYSVEFSGVPEKEVVVLRKA